MNKKKCGTLQAFDTLSPDFPAKQLHLICAVSPIAVHGSVGFFFPQHCYHLQLSSFYLFNMFLNYTGKKCQLIVFFSLYFLGKTGHSYKEALDFPHILEHHHHYHSTGPLWPPHSLYQNADTVSCRRRVLSEHHVA